MLELAERGEMDGRREDVVRALAHVDVVVRMHVLAGERRDHLVRVHVRARARAGLEDVDRELVVVLAAARSRRRRRRSARPCRRRAARARRSTRAAAALIRPSQRATGTGIGSPETGKLATALRRLATPELPLGRRAHAVESSRGSRSSSQRAELDPRAAVRLARRALGEVDRLPARVQDGGDAALLEQRLERPLAAWRQQARRARPRAAARRSRSRPSCSSRSRRSARA